MLTSFIKFVIDPFNILWILVLVTIAVYFLKKEYFFKYAASLSIFWFIIISTPLIPGIALNSLENRYEPIIVENLTDSNAYYHIIILGGGHGFDDRLPANSLLSLNALGRLTEGIRLHRQLPNSRLIMSGYSASGRTTQAEMLRDTALLMGVEESRMLMQKEPGNTYEEAKFYSERFTDGNKVILVTSAAHMPRAVMMFERFGVEVIPSPTNYKLTGEDIAFVGIPSMRNISYLHTGLYEYAGIIRYRYY